MKAVQIYNFYIQTSQKQQGTLTDATISLPYVLTKKAKNSYFSIRCNSLTVPFSFHQLSPDISTVQVEYRDSTLNTKTTNITLQSGNYNCVNVLDELKSKLISNAQISSGGYIGYTPNLTFSYSNTTNKSTYLLSSDPNTRITIYFSNNSLLGKFFGFNTDLILEPSISILSPSICIANPVHTIYLRSGNLKQLYNREWIVEQDTYSDVLYASPIFSQQNTYIQANHQGDECLMSDDTIKDINLYISTNLSYNPIELNGLDFTTSITLSEMILDKYEPITDSTLNTIALMNPISNISNISSISKEEEEGKDNTKNIKNKLYSMITRDKIKLEKERDRLVEKLLKYKDKVEKDIKKTSQPINKEGEDE